MSKLGYWLSSEEHTPNDLVRSAQMAEEVGFRYAMISDHFHPWTDSQGQSPFVWSVLGGIASTTKQLELGTGVTCPTFRYHPAIIAQAAATIASMMPGRFFLGVGTGENLNEHIIGQHWPSYDIRAAMMEEAIEVIRLLWEGGLKSHHGRYYTAENARIYTLPEKPTPIFVAASGKESSELAGKIGDGLVTVGPNKEAVQAFDAAGGKGKLKRAQFSLCWAQTREQAVRTAYEIWPTAGLTGTLSQELPLPKNFEEAASLVTQDQIAQSVICGPDPEPVLKKIEEFANLGIDYVYLHQIGPDQEGFIHFCKREILPRWQKTAS